MAMLIAEQREKWAGWQVDIVGTDVSYHAISRARVGLYSQFEIQRGLPVQRMVRWFDQTEGGWLAKADLRRRIDFSVQNMLTDRPPLASPADLMLRPERIDLSAEAGAEGASLPVTVPALARFDAVVLSRTSCADIARPLMSKTEKLPFIVIRP